jgi:hypothetical protein
MENQTKSKSTNQQNIIELNHNPNRQLNDSEMLKLTNNPDKISKIPLSKHSFNKTNSLQNDSRNNSRNNPQQDSLQPSGSFQLLGRIDNPILAINAAQQTNSMSQSYSTSHHPNNSLNYSNSSGNHLTNQYIELNNSSNGIIMNSQSHNSCNHNNSLNPYSTPIINPMSMVVQPLGQYQNSINNSNSFGQHNGVSNPAIGPSFYQNASNESGNNMKTSLFIKGMNNRLAYV